MDNGGLQTDGVDKDPVSGNPVPAGSNAEDVRDNVDAKLSAGEYVVPADVVKFFGVAHFEKLRDKAKEGMESMKEGGRIGGDGNEEPTLSSDVDSISNYATGGLVAGTDVDGIIDRVKAAAMADPSIVNTLKAKGINISSDAGSPPSLEGQNKPQEFAEGGPVLAGPTFNTADYAMGFSSNQGSTTADVAPVCPEGYSWDEKTKVCQPVQVAATPEETPLTSEQEYSGEMMENAAQDDSKSWMENYNYADPNQLFSQTMDTIAFEGEEPVGGKGFLGGLANLASKTLLGGVLGQFIASQNSARASANSITLRAMGHTEFADKIDAKNKGFVESKGISKVPEGWRDGKKLAQNVAEQKKDVIGGLKKTDSTPQGETTATYTAPTGSDRSPEDSSATQVPTEYASDTNTTSHSRTQDTGNRMSAVSTARSGEGISAQTANSMSGHQMEAGSGVGENEDGSDYAGPMNKGGLVQPRKKVKTATKDKVGGLGQRRNSNK